MGQCYGQLSLEERVEIYRLHAGGKSQNQIASALDRSPSTISRELQRNSRPTKVWKGGYVPVRAQQLAERRRRQDGRFKLARQPDLRNHVGKSLAMGHSPEQIAGRLALEHGRVIISHESIYRFIYHRTAQKDYWHRLLPRPPPAPRRQPRQLHQTTAPDHRTTGRGRRTRGAGPLGSRLHAVRPIWPRVACSARTTNPLQHRSTPGRSKSCPHRSDHRPSTRQASTGDAQNHYLRQRNRVRRASQASQRPQRPNLLLRSPQSMAKRRRGKLHWALTTLTATQNRPQTHHG